MAKDPVCGMEVDERKAIKLNKTGMAYFFCSERCKTKFSVNGEKSFGRAAGLASGTKNGIYTCPMHPEIEQDTPGDCPQCGMPLEPKHISIEEDDMGDDVF